MRGRGRGRGRGRSGTLRPYCTYCKMQGHTEDTCYHKHGWPSGMSPIGGRGSGNTDFRQANVALGTEQGNINTAEGMTLQKEQYEALMGLLKNGTGNNAPSPSRSHITTNFISKNNPNTSKYTLLVLPQAENAYGGTWILDTGATNHVICDHSMFMLSTPI
ncbi:unnamed protein product [Linum trigynum]|uniref:Uncharacterized protein n=1 Tax=Linum trigynum TaxID=586398 RepID=A0AAV2DTW6_9ROSI